MESAYLYEGREWKGRKEEEKYTVKIEKNISFLSKLLYF